MVGKRCRRLCPSGTPLPISSGTTFGMMAVWGSLPYPAMPSWLAVMKTAGSAVDLRSSVPELARNQMLQSLAADLLVMLTKQELRKAI